MLSLCTIFFRDSQTNLCSVLVLDMFYKNVTSVFFHFYFIVAGYGANLIQTLLRWGKKRLVISWSGGFDMLSYCSRTSAGIIH